MGKKNVIIMAIVGALLVFLGSLMFVINLIQTQNQEKETKLYANDSVILYIPEVDVYPDMVKEKWTLSKVQDFAKENNLTLDITYKETTDVEENIVLSQGRDPGDPIYNGYTLKITISKTKLLSLQSHIICKLRSQSFKRIMIKPNS